MNSKYKFILITVIVLAAVSSMFAFFFLPGLLNRKLQKLLHEHCETCILKVADLHFYPWRETLVLEDIWFYSGDPAYTAGEVKIKSVSLKVSLKDLLARRVQFKEVRIESPDVLLTEGDKRFPDEMRKRKNSDWSCSELIINKGSFTYSRTYPNRPAILHLKEIDGVVGTWDSRNPEWITQGTASGILEHSGKFRLSVKSPLFSEATNTEIDLTLQELNLIDMNPFFEASEGIQLTGALHRGQANVKVRGSELESWVSAKYEGLNLHFRKTSQRGALTAFFSNLIGSIKVSESNLSHTRAKQVRGVSAKRNSLESLVSFIIRGIRDAALKVSMEK